MKFESSHAIHLALERHLCNLVKAAVVEQSFSSTFAYSGRNTKDTELS